MKRVVLNKTNNTTTNLIALTKEQALEVQNFLNDELEEHLKDKELTFLKDTKNVSIVGVGGSKEISSHLLQQLIPIVTNFLRKEPTLIGAFKYVSIKDYKCYAKMIPHPYNNICLHEDVKSSFNCALSVINKPEYCLITKEYEPN